MKRIVLSLLAMSLLLIYSCDKNESEPITPSDTPDGYTLVWSDEFDGSNILAANWNHETGDGTDYGLPAGWGNNEKQIYTSNATNSSIKTEEGNSVLAITAMKDNEGGFTSAKMTTKNLMTMRFGRIDIKAKMPEGQGIWPAIWMLGHNIDEISWPGCGEIDIAEILGHQTSTLNTTLHYTTGEKKHGQIQNIYNLPSGSFSDGFHVYTLDWNPQSLNFSLDGKELYQVMIEDDMKEFMRSFYLILNVAVGGNLVGDPDETTVFPQSMYIDYVRVYSKHGLQIPASPALNIDEETVGQDIEPNIGDNAIRDDFYDLGSLSVVTYGPGEPFITTTDTAIDGNLSLVYDFPGGDWGGAYIELETPADLSSYNYLKFFLNKPTTMVNAEIKLESPGSNFAVFLENYQSVAVDNGFMEYSIPLSDFTDLDLSEISIPFAIWNPQDANQTIIPARVLIDDVYFSN